MKVSLSEVHSGHVQCLIKGHETTFSKEDDFHLYLLDYTSSIFFYLSLSVKPNVVIFLLPEAFFSSTLHFSTSV